MVTTQRQFKVAAAQVDAVFYDAQANLVKIIALIEEAAAAGAKLVVFSELALSGYPFHIWLKPYHEQIPYIEDFYTKAAVEADGLEMRALQATCVAHRIRAVIGFSERDGGSLFMSQWLIGPDGDVVVRRKLKPTSLERIVYGEGDGSDIRVHETELGRVGLLQCWQGNSAILTAYAIETGTFVVSASSYFSQQNLDKLFGAQGGPLTAGSGWTTIIDPEGRTLATAEHDKTCIIYADINLDACYKAKSVLDPLGHYARRDVFQDVVTDDSSM
ncbi:hypothetical protein Rhopal_006400-T1 [Rhodotorula paludigena]|uniref:CN hydrolase domain-containing protein n=1 Tax=Rhodotorula paludigena TaxID=86838 RepID=A0AAV5GV38_9BASI|nr:hypothetical protein Rhopal_006400-T1 [Rhodotorula paludigena]